jgi:protease-4
MPNLSSSVNNADAQVVLNQIVLDYLREKKRKKVWRWLKSMVFVVLIVFVFFKMFEMHAEEAAARSNPHVGLIDVEGGIFERQSADADSFIKGMDSAYQNKTLKALILRINSPGGSPVQADYMYQTTKYYRQKYPDVKIYAVCVDICASAAYYVAAAADEIYANPSSLVGSIGVLYNGFGFVDTLQKLGVSRRLQTAGKYKGFMDEFSPINDDDKKRLQTMLDTVHQQFIDRVKAGRGQRLHQDDETFSGLFWTGLQAKERGLIDGFASSGQLARDVIKVEKIIDYTYQPSVLEKVAKNFGTAMANQLPMALGIQPGLQ